MAHAPVPVLSFDGGCPDCGQRRVSLPGRLPEIGDDFDWLQRDYDSFRLAIMEDLAARFPERRKWTPADMEVVLVETLAVVLDQLSDMMDRVHAEAFLATARRPDSVWRLLKFIGYNPLEGSELSFDPEDPVQVAAARALLQDNWLKYPAQMDAAKIDGPRNIQRQRRMVTQADVVAQLEKHPLVLRASAGMRWTGSWHTLEVSCVIPRNTPLDQAVDGVFGVGTEQTQGLRGEIDAFHRANSLRPVAWPSAPTIRAILQVFLGAYRMAGQEIWLRDPLNVPILVDLTVLARDGFYRSEVRRAVEETLGTGLGGYFSPARLRFGEDLHASDLISAVMALDGVEAVCLNRFKRIGNRYDDQSDGGRIVLEGTEIAICDNDPDAPGRGILRARVSGGLAG